MDFQSQTNIFAIFRHFLRFREFDSWIIEKICRKLKLKYKFKYDINAILSDLIYARILEPSSKRSSFKTASGFLEKPYSQDAIEACKPGDIIYVFMELDDQHVHFTIRNPSRVSYSPSEMSNFFKKGYTTKQDVDSNLKRGFGLYSLSHNIKKDMASFLQIASNLMRFIGLSLKWYYDFGQYFLKYYRKRV